MKKAIAVIPARKGSKRVLDKNIREFMGQPLVVYSIKAAKLCNDIERIIVSTNDQRVSELADKYGVEVLWRPENLATDKARTFDVLKHVWNEINTDVNAEYEYIVLLQPTSPLREKDLISTGVDMMAADQKASSLVSVYKETLFTGVINDNGYWVPDYPEETRSQDLKAFFVPTGNLYIYRCSATIEKNDALGTGVLPLIEDIKKVVNIDNESDLIKLKWIFENNREIFSYLL